MAKRTHHRRHSTALAVRPIAMTAPRPIVIRQVKAPKVKHHRKSRRAGGGSEKHRALAIAGGAVLGLIDKSAVSLPSLPFLGKAGTLGVAAWAVGKYMHSPMAEDLATGFLAIAAYELTKEGTISGVEGEYIAGGL